MRTRFVVLVLIALAAAVAWRAAPVGAQGDPVSAAIGSREPPLGEILRRLGYSIDVGTPEVDAQRFVKLGDGPATHEPLAAYGLERVCSGGWYSLVEDIPEKRSLWRIDEAHNKQDRPPLMEGSGTTFDPGGESFGLWVATEGFREETIHTEDVRQRAIQRFGENRHKAHIYVAKRNGRAVPGVYLIGWEYSTNDDNQDVVTLVSNVRPARPGE